MLGYSNISYEALSYGEVHYILVKFSIQFQETFRSLVSIFSFLTSVRYFPCMLWIEVALFSQLSYLYQQAKWKLGSKRVISIPNFRCYIISSDLHSVFVLKFTSLKQPLNPKQVSCNFYVFTLESVIFLQHTHKQSIMQ